MHATGQRNQRNQRPKIQERSKKDPRKIYSYLYSGKCHAKASARLSRLHGFTLIAIRTPTPCSLVNQTVCYSLLSHYGTGYNSNLTHSLTWGLIRFRIVQRSEISEPKTEVKQDSRRNRPTFSYVNPRSTNLGHKINTPGPSTRSVVSVSYPSPFVLIEYRPLDRKVLLFSHKIHGHIKIPV